MGYSQDATARRSGMDMTDSSSIVAVWRAVRARLREECGDLVYAAEIARLRVELDAAGRVCVICPNEFGRAWVEDNVGVRLRALWANVAEQACDIVICTEKTLSSAKSQSASVAALNAGGVSETAALPPVESAEPEAKREARFTFDTFMVGSANMMAATAARAVASCRMTMRTTSGSGLCSPSASRACWWAAALPRRSSRLGMKVGSVA